MNNSIDQETAIEYFGKHCVGIVIRCAHANGKITTHLFSGVLVANIDDGWWILTAGHILSDLEQLEKDHGGKIDSCMIIDSLSSNPKVRDGTPFPFSSVYKYHCWNAQTEELGLDYAMIQVSSLFKDSFGSNGCEAYPIGQMHLKPNCDFEVVLMYGFPTQRVEADERAKRLKYEPVMVSVIDPPDTDYVNDKLKDGWYAGVVEGKATLPSIVGMSGGPLFGFFHVEGKLVYTLLGIQSGWCESNRIIHASRMLRILEHRLFRYNYMKSLGIVEDEET